MKQDNRKRKKVCFFGHFGMFNSGNESTLQAMLFHLRRLRPEADIACICDQPEIVAATHNIGAIPISSPVVKPWKIQGPLARLLRKLIIGIPSEVYRWFDAYRTLKRTDMFVIPGTGLLTDVYGLFGWGPYNLFKWTVLARLRRCKVVFASVGTGPIYSVRGRWLVKSALSLADFRSYRDRPSMRYAEGIGVCSKDDRIYPDLVFSLPKSVMPHDEDRERRKRVVGLGLMDTQGGIASLILVVRSTRHIWSAL